MSISQIVIGVLSGNAITAGIVYCFWLAKRDPDSRKGFWIALMLCLVIGITAYAARQ